MKRERTQAYATVSAILVSEFCTRHHVVEADEVVTTWQQHCTEHDLRSCDDDVTITLDEANWSYALSATARDFCDAAFAQERQRYEHRHAG